MTPALQRIAWVSRRAVRNECAPDSCIESTRVLIEVARYFGVEVRPLAVRVQLFNAEAWDQLQARVPLDEWTGGAFSLGIDGEAPRTGKWNGHLVGLAPGHVIDASADQFSRPAKGITIDGPMVLPRPPGWPASGGPAAWLAPDDGLRIIYEPGVRDPSWRKAPAWSGHRAAYREVAGQAIRALRTLEGDPDDRC